MASIVFDVEQFICETPVFTGVTYTGTRYEFDLNWFSQGSYYSTFDPTTNIALTVDIYELNTTNLVTSFSIDPSAPFDGNHYMVNILDYLPSHSNKDTIVFTLTLTSTGCTNNVTTYTVPGGTY